ncbi:MAG: tRNA (guanosine(46)-N7)-methyltransferase TrmB [Oligoflexia bacterium]|nr:tRNA (guanosine(46)-N7)-methyltransferase TrmB [Oligoflexia bacterium]
MALFQAIVVEKTKHSSEMSTKNDAPVKIGRWKNQYIDLVAQCEEYIISFPNRGIPEDARARFLSETENWPRIVVEIGSGSGGHIIEQAALAPEVLHIGIELRFKRAFKTAEKAQKRGLTNVRLLRANARILPEICSPGRLDGVYVNFPDPWDKKRWLKNRILNPEFLEQLHGLLSPQGYLSYKSDHQGYFAETLSQLEKSGKWHILHKTTDLYSSELLSRNVPSEFELLFKSKKIPIGYLLAQKIGAISIPDV